MGIPMMDISDTQTVTTGHYGAGSYVTTIENVDKKDYEIYLKKVEECKFSKYADNGKGLGGTVFCSTYVKEEVVLTIAYYSMKHKMSIAFYQDMPLSEHLLYQDSYVEGNKENVKTKIHMLELWRLGNSFVFQLKNGHFLISDGGMAQDTPYLLDYLESLTPEGEKPIVEAWVISHAHGDHCGALFGLLENSDWLSRIYVNGVYFSEPNMKVTNLCGGDFQSGKMKFAIRKLQTCEGKKTPIYRPQTGQRYYFNDITMDILLTQEQVPYEIYKDDLNSSSTVCLFTIEGQKCFFAGDIHQEGLHFIKQNYTKEYLNLDLFTLNHHGFNTSVEFTDYIKVKTLLLTLQEQLPVRRIRETKHFISTVEETMRWGDGTKILTFPYEMGTYESLPCKEWIYNEGQERLLQMNLYTFPGRTLKGFIFNADEVIFDKETLKPGVTRLLQYLREKEVYMSAYSICKKSQELRDELKCTEIDSYFDVIIGNEQLSTDTTYADAIKISEDRFLLDHVHKYVVVCNSESVVEATLQEGIRSLVVTDGQEIDKKKKEKCWKAIDSLENIYDLFERKRILFE